MTRVLANKLHHNTTTGEIYYATSTGNIHIQCFPSKSTEGTRLIYNFLGVLGIIEISGVLFLLIVMDGEKVSCEMGSGMHTVPSGAIYKLKEVAFVCLDQQSVDANDIGGDEIINQIESVKMLLQDGHFYFTFSEDFQNCFQWNKKLKEEFIKRVVKRKKVAGEIQESNVARRSPFMTKRKVKISSQRLQAVTDHESTSQSRDSLPSMQLESSSIKISHEYFDSFSTASDFQLATLFCGYYEEAIVYKDPLNKNERKSSHHHLNNHSCYRISILSTISTKRIGPRMLSRGVDAKGYSSFFVETNFRVHHNENSTEPLKQLYTFTIARGSVPLYWAQHDPLQPKKIWFMREQENEQAFSKHMSLLKEHKKEIVIVDLLGRREHEALLSQMYRELCLKHGYRYMNFKLHDYISDYEGMKKVFCMKLDNLIMGKIKSENKIIENLSYESDSCNEESTSSSSKLYQEPFSSNEDDDEEEILDEEEDDNKEMLEEEMLRNSFSQLPIETGKNKLENYFIRVNCLDCLDRTNLCQFIIFDADTPYKFNESKKLWKNNGDALARMYTGSNALFGGIMSSQKKLTIYGRVNDIYSNCYRFYNNKFTDKEKEKAINTLLQLHKTC